MWNYTNIDSLASDVAAISRRVAPAARRDAFSQWQLRNKFNIVQLTEQDVMRGFYSYMPQRRRYIAGDPSPATCHSDPHKLDVNVLDAPISTPLRAIEIAYEICKKSNISKSLRDVVYDKEFGVAMKFEGFLQSSAFYGDASSGHYGLFNHPLTDIDSAPDPTTPVNGETVFESYTANEIVSLIRDQMKGMLNPKLAISEAAWNMVADKALADGDNCNRAGDCIIKLVRQSESVFNWTGTLNQDFFVEKWLDDVMLDGVTPSNGIFIVWDSDSVEIPTTDVIPISPKKENKYVDLIREISNNGAVIRFADTVSIVTGINEVQAI